jgi:hypothetical protein
MTNAMEAIVSSIRNGLNNNLLDTNTTASPLSSSNDARDFRKTAMPGTRIGLGSREGDLISMVKKYLEIVGLVFFVWLLGE